METLKERLSLIKRYPTEILVIICLLAISALWSKCNDMQSKFDNYILNDKQILYEIVGSNTLALKENARALTVNTEAFNKFVSYNENSKHK